MSDFIREVSEDYRRERIIRFLTKNATALAVVAVLIVVATVGWRLYLDRREAGAQTTNARYEAALDLQRAGDGAKAQAAFEQIAKDGPAGYATLARMAAAQTLAARDPDAAANAFDAIANEGAISPALRDAARYRGAVLRLDSEDAKAFEQRYGRFSAAGFAFAGGMRELLALAAIKRNDFEAAGKFLDEIIVDPLSPPALRDRAQVFRALVTAGPATPIAATPPAPTLTPVEPAPATGTPSIDQPAVVQAPAGAAPAANPQAPAGPAPAAPPAATAPQGAAAAPPTAPTPPPPGAPAAH